VEVDLRRLLGQAAEGADRHRAVAALLAAAALAGCGSSRVDREDLEKFPGGLYYAGVEFAGLPLTHAETGGLFVYGSCNPSGDDGGCAPPIEIQHFAFRRGDWSRAMFCRRLPSLRGVPTVRHDGLVLLTRDGVVKIYARTPAEDRRVALALRPVNARTPARLAPPSSAVVRLVNRRCR